MYTFIIFSYISLSTVYIFGTFSTEGKTVSFHRGCHFNSKLLIDKTYFCELSRLDLSLILRQFSSFAIVTCRFFSGSFGEGIDLGVVGVDPGEADRRGGRARVKGGGASVIGGRRAFSAASCADAECNVNV